MILFWILPTCSPLPLYFPRGKGKQPNPTLLVFFFYFREISGSSLGRFGAFSERVKKRKNKCNPVNK